MSDKLSDEQWRQIEQHLYENRKIEAIKLLREYTGSSLVDAKGIIDRHTQDLRSQFPDRFKSPVAGGCSTAVFFLLAGLLS